MSTFSILRRFSKKTYNYANSGDGCDILVLSVGTKREAYARHMHIQVQIKLFLMTELSSQFGVRKQCQVAQCTWVKYLNLPEKR